MRRRRVATETRRPTRRSQISDTVGTDPVFEPKEKPSRSFSTTTCNGNVTTCNYHAFICQSPAHPQPHVTTVSEFRSNRQVCEMHPNLRELLFADPTVQSRFRIPDKGQPWTTLQSVQSSRYILVLYCRYRLRSTPTNQDKAAALSPSAPVRCCAGKAAKSFCSLCLGAKWTPSGASLSVYAE